METGWMRADAADGPRLACGGAWTIDHAAALDRASRQAVAGIAGGTVTLDLSAVSALDTAGAWLLVRSRAALAAAGTRVAITGLAPAHGDLMARVETAATCDLPERVRPNALLALLERLGRGLVAALAESRRLLGFFGLVAVTWLRVLPRPRRWRLPSVVSMIEAVAIDALPLVGLLAFVIGVVLAYIGADQLSRFGAEIFTVNLVGVAVLRELGILITAIILAGRSGSAFTAQIGTMKVNQEVDALETLGIDPIEVLVLPRLLALTLTLPLLTFYADILGLAGGATIAWLVLDIPVGTFVAQLQTAITPAYFLVGLSKAPVFGLLIGLVGCYKGLRTTGSAESVGRLTTDSVVISIFLVIVTDAMFAVLYSAMGV